ncbi:MAG: alpha-ketoacid dehydrogenase subunit beta [Candidatus Atabeyarchaeum deiterrae]
MREITVRDAIREALREEMKRDKTVFLMGEDIGKYWQGAFKVTQGLADEFGDQRVRDTPISENTFVGAAIGSAMTGMRPVVEIMFGDLIALAVDQIVNQAAKIHYMFGGQVKVPVVIRTPYGAGTQVAAHHSSTYLSWFMHAAGLKLVVASTPYDAKGLLKTAIRGNSPVLFAEHKILYGVKGNVPDEDYTIPFGKADIKKEGSDVTIIGVLYMVQKALGAAKELESQGIKAEVIDPRTLVPFDRKTIGESVKKTGHAVVVSEDCRTAGVSGEIASIIMEEAFDYLDAPIMRVTAPDTPVPFSPVLESCFIPDEKKIVKAVKEIVG